MIFTRHACERYRQFHMLDRPTATDADAASILVAYQADAAKLPTRTLRGDEVWTIHALGVELVVKRDADFTEPVCVTVLPPARFRGLTPLQAERVEVAAQEARARAEEARQREEEARVELAAAAARLKEVNRQAASARQVAVRAEAAARKADVAQAHREQVERLAAEKAKATEALIERDIICGVLKTMRMQMHNELDETRLKAALRAALRCARKDGAAGVLEAVRGVDKGLASDKFIDGDG